MKKNLIYVAVFGILCVLAGVLIGVSMVRRAMPPVPRFDRMRFSQHAERVMGYRPGGPEDARPGREPFEMLARKLNLNEEQKVKVKAIFENTRQELDNIRKSVRGNVDKIKEKTDSQIMEVLNDKQKEKFKEFLEEIGKKFAPARDGGPEDFSPPHEGPLPPLR